MLGQERERNDLARPLDGINEWHVIAVSSR
jgi:hypothetical protein